MENWQQTVLSQFANAPRILTILEGFNQAVDPSALIDDWYDNVWNVQTAVGWGLDVWGRIVGIGRVLQISDQEFWGFSQGSPTSQPFDQAPFYNGGQTTSNYAMADDVYRKVIMAKAASNITDGSITSINAILMTLFEGRGSCYVHDGNDMTMQYIFEFAPTTVDLAVVLSSGVIPRPSGVQFSYYFIPSAVIDNDFGGDIV